METAIGVAIDIALDIIVSQIVGAFGRDNVDDTTEFNFTEFASGTGQYYYLSTDGSQELRTGSFTFSPDFMKDGTTVINTGDYSISASLVSSVGTRPSVYVSQDGFSMNSGTMFSFHFDGQDGGGFNGINVYPNSIPTFHEEDGLLYGQAMGLKNVALASEDFKRVAQMYGDYPAIIPSGRYTYPQFQQAIIDFYEDEYDIDLNITPEDLPTIGEILGEEETEPSDSSGGFDFDYGEVISPSELWDILDTEQYDWNEAETDLMELPDLETIPTAETDEVEADVLATIPVLATVSLNMLGTVGLLSVFTSTAIIAMILKILRNKKGD